MGWVFIVWNHTDRDSDCFSWRCGASTSHTQPPPSPPCQRIVKSCDLVQDFESNNTSPFTARDLVKGSSAPAAEGDVSYPGQIPDSSTSDLVETFAPTPPENLGDIIHPVPPSSSLPMAAANSAPRPISPSRTIASLKARPGSAGGKNERPSSAGKTREESSLVLKDRPGSAGKTREDTIVPHKAH